MPAHERSFRLAAQPGGGICCDERGLSVGAVPLLMRADAANNMNLWTPRPTAALNADLGERYGLPIDVTSKVAGLAAVASALDGGEIARAQITALHLHFPDPPSLSKSAKSADHNIDLARRLAASGLLKRDFNPAQHPRWPSGSPDSAGGRFAPADASGGGSSVAPEAKLAPAQLTIPAPFDIPAPETIPFPPSIAPPIVVPFIAPREIPQNPYPDRPECVEEWDHARRECGKLLAGGLLGKGPYRQLGRTYRECVMGMISESCGGNPIA